MTAPFRFEQISKDYLDEILPLAQCLNPKLGIDLIKSRFDEMFSNSNFICFGVFENATLIGIAGAWITTRIYSGKQLELDNVILHPNIQSKGIGSQFIQCIENWALENAFETIELNTYTQNVQSHKFYYKQGFTILGFHFWKAL